MWLWNYGIQSLYSANIFQGHLSPWYCVLGVRNKAQCKTNFCSHRLYSQECDIIILQLTLEQCEFELCGSAYTWIFFNKYVLQYCTVYKWLNPQMLNCGYRRLTIKVILEFLTSWLVSISNPCVVQGSTIYCGKYYRSFSMKVAFNWDPKRRVGIIQTKR